MSGTNNNHPFTVVFDFGGVLVDWDPRYLYSKMFDDAEGVEAFFASVRFFEWNLEQDRGYPFSKAVEEHAARFPAYAEYIRAYDLRYEEAIQGPILPVVDILHRLKQAGYPLYALSNWSVEKFEVVRKQYKFFDWFDGIIISGAVRLIKPDPRIYTLLLEKTGRPAEECIFIDDSAKNVETARQLGFKTIHYRSPEQLRAELGQFGIQAT